MEPLYAKCHKLILGVPTSTCNISVFVRLGVLPLRFHLLRRALVWYLKAYHGEASKAVQDQLFSFYENDEIWMHSCFYNPSFRELCRLNSISDINLWSVKPMKASILIRDAFYSEVNNFWQNFQCPPDIKIIHPSWKFSRFNKFCHSRYTCSIFHSCALGRGKLYGFLYKCGSAPSPNCRLGCPDHEDIAHVFIKCTQNQDKINNLKEQFKKSKLIYNLETIFTNPKDQIDVQKYLYDYFSV